MNEVTDLSEYRARKAARSDARMVLPSGAAIEFKLPSGCTPAMVAFTTNGSDGSIVHVPVVRPAIECSGCGKIAGKNVRWSADTGWLCSECGRAVLA